MQYKCPKCSAVLSDVNNKYICGYCKSEYDADYFNGEKTYDYVIPFEIDKQTAIKIYLDNMKSKLLTPSFFKRKKRINEFQGVYVPCYLYKLDSTGEIEFENNRISTWKSSGINYRKIDTYKVIRGGEMTIKDMLIPSTTYISSSLINEVEPYNYDKQVEFENSYTQNYKVYDSDITKEKLLMLIKDKSKDIFVNEIRKDIKDYNEIKDINNSINLYNPTKETLLVPIWLLSFNYKKKNYTYIINGQTGLFIGKIPINKIKLIFIWIILFIIIFIILFLLSYKKVIVW